MKIKAKLLRGNNRSRVYGVSVSVADSHRIGIGTMAYPWIDSKWFSSNGIPITFWDRVGTWAKFIHPTYRTAQIRFMWFTYAVECFLPGKES